jgi:hypothetical protein
LASKEKPTGTDTVDDDTTGRARVQEVAPADMRWQHSPLVSCNPELYSIFLFWLWKLFKWSSLLP